MFVLLLSLVKSWCPDIANILRVIKFLNSLFRDYGGINCYEIVREMPWIPMATVIWMVIRKLIRDGLYILLQVGPILGQQNYIEI